MKEAYSARQRTLLRQSKLRCHGCGSVLDERNDSRAHIIPNALGGRLAPRGIICGTCNTFLADYADTRFVRAFGPWPTLLNVPRQAGKHPPVRVSGDQGKEIRVEADGSRTIARPTYNKTPIPQGNFVELSAPTPKLMDQLVGKLVSEHPHVSRDEAKAHAKVVQEPPVNSRPN